MEYWLMTTGPASQPGIDAGWADAANPAEGPKTPSASTPLIPTWRRSSPAAAGYVHLKSAVPGAGWLAYCQDIEGNQFGRMQDDPAAAQAASG